MARVTRRGARARSQRRRPSCQRTRAEHARIHGKHSCAPELRRSTRRREPRSDDDGPATSPPAARPRRRRIRRVRRLARRARAARGVGRARRRRACGGGRARGSQRRRERPGADGGSRGSSFVGGVPRGSGVRTRGFRRE